MKRKNLSIKKKKNNTINFILNIRNKHNNKKFFIMKIYGNTINYFISR